MKRAPKKAGCAIGDSPADPLAVPVQQLAGIGTVRARRLGALGVSTVRDMLLFKPRRYEDRRECDAMPWAAGQTRPLRALIKDARLKRWGWRRCLLDSGATAADGRPIRLRWFNMPYLAQRIVPGARLWVFGKMKCADGIWSMDNPEFEAEEDDAEGFHRDRIVPVYPLAGQVPQRTFRSAVAAAIASLPEKPPPTDPALDTYGDWLWAVRGLHFPQTLSEAERARRRLAIEEFLAWQTALCLRRADIGRSPSVRFEIRPEVTADVLANAGFKPTGAQGRVIHEIYADLGRRVPMNRLLQGDVGSGKTLVAAIAMAQVAAAGHSCALMAPTAVLARQHFGTLRQLIGPSGLQLRLLTGEEGGGEGPAGPAIWVGTHALFQESTKISDLALVVIDEQHRFGVGQRARLRAKGQSPHLLVMSATPIPRTLGLTLYGDLDTSILDERPPGRRPPQTRVHPPSEIEGVWAFAKAKADEGKQIFVVFPSIGAGGPGGMKSVESEYGAVRARFHPHRIVVAHGRMPPEERDAAMHEFAAGKVPVLLATTLVEVGLDVPGASVMIIEHAERFGLAQLHQMRGRVGRRGEPSWCILVWRGSSDTSRRRLEALAHNDDGFKIAEIDFQSRGAGELLGSIQSGRVPFRIGNLMTDAALIIAARDLARDALARDPGLADPTHAILATEARALARRFEAGATDPA